MLASVFEIAFIGETSPVAFYSDMGKFGGPRNKGWETGSEFPHQITGFWPISGERKCFGGQQTIQGQELMARFGRVHSPLWGDGENQRL
jgi:hypothetical protein